MFLANCREFRLVKQIRQPYDGRPETPMNIGHLPIQQTADEHIGGIADCASRPEDRTPLFMAPPAATDWLTSYCLSQIGARSFRGFKQNALLFDELNRIVYFHVVSEQF